jgi:hypothetical protein
MTQRYPRDFGSSLNAEAPVGFVIGLIRGGIPAGVQSIKPTQFIDCVLEPSGMNVSSTVSLLFKSNVMKLGSENGVFSGSVVLLILVIRPNVPFYWANVPVELATTNPP